MEVTSPAFGEGDPIPVRFSCDGQNISPELEIASPPIGTITLALIVDDPDAPVGTWDHWVEYDIAVGPGDQLWPEDAGRLGVQGVNSWNLSGYGGPCPPQGENHRYFFTVFALDAEFLIPEGIDSDALRTAMEGHILGEAQLMGTYSR
jgi:Raf kinase inhibitor-like YbhB/YbcL family protein